jgi:ABC-type sugar transport system ATPase subunit
MLKIIDLQVRFDHFRLRDISIDVEKGQYYVILGPSGAGKSVLLETIAGLIRPERGYIYLAGEDITAKPVQNRDIGLVLQDGAVFPHLSVRKNIAFSFQGLRRKKMKINGLIEQMAERINIRHLLDRMPSSLSGGEIQRVAIARTLVRNPKCLLLDEPLASLDVQLRDDLRELLRMLNSQGVTIIHVTHDFHEAFLLGRRIAVMDHGMVIREGSPDELFANPGSRFVAGFIGLKNHFYYSRTSVDEILIEDKLPLSGIQNIATKGFILFPHDAIDIGLQDNANYRVNIPGKVIRVTRLLEKSEVVVDARLKFYLSIDTSAHGCQFTEGQNAVIHLDPSQAIFLGK